jgi:hypothetical protein
VLPADSHTESGGSEAKLPFLGTAMLIIGQIMLPFFFFSLFPNSAHFIFQISVFEVSFGKEQRRLISQMAKVRK